MSQSTRFLFTAALLSAIACWSQNVPSGWKVIKDKQGACQLAVPPDWTTDKLLPSFAKSPDGKANAVAHGVRSGQSFAQATAMAKQVMKPSKMIEDSGKRLWYAYEGNSSANGGTNWYIAVPGTPVCTAQVSFKDPSLEDTAKKVALSLSPAK